LLLHLVAQAQTTLPGGQGTGPVSEGAFWAIVGFLAAGLLGVFAFIWNRDATLRSEARTDIKGLSDDVTTQFNNLRTNDLADLKARLTDLKTDMNAHKTDIKHDVGKVGDQVTSLDRELSGRFENLQAVNTGRFDRIEQRVEAGLAQLSSRIDDALASLRIRVSDDDQLSTIADLQRQIRALARNVSSILETISDIDDITQTLDGKLGNINAATRRFSADLRNLRNDVLQRASRSDVEEVRVLIDDIGRRFQELERRVRELLGRSVTPPDTDEQPNPDAGEEPNPDTGSQPESR
jgi:chromosome segregation ATPase